MHKVLHGQTALSSLAAVKLANMDVYETRFIKPGLEVCHRAPHTDPKQTPASHPASQSPPTVELLNLG